MAGNPYTPPQPTLSLLLYNPRLSEKELHLPHGQSRPHLCQVITEPPCGAKGPPPLKENPEAGPVGRERDLSCTEDALNASGSPIIAGGVCCTSGQQALLPRLLSVSLLHAAGPSLSGGLLPCSSHQRGALCLLSCLDQRLLDSVFHAGPTP